MPSKHFARRSRARLRSRTHLRLILESLEARIVMAGPDGDGPVGLMPPSYYGVNSVGGQGLMPSRSGAAIEAGSGHGHNHGSGNTSSNGSSKSHLAPAWQPEKEKAGQHSNDSIATAELLKNVGTKAGNVPEVSILGSLGQTAREISVREDDGSIPKANATGLVAGRDGSIIARGRVGNGPHGSAGTRTGDYDFYKVSANAGQLISVNVEAESLRMADSLSDFYENSLDAVAAVYDSAGNVLTFNDNYDYYRAFSEVYNQYFTDKAHFDPAFRFTAPANGDYYVVVFGSFDAANAPALQASPFDSASGQGAANEGDYLVTITTESPRRLQVADEVGGIENGAIQYAIDTGISPGNDSFLVASGTIGDGLYGKAGTGSGDFDMFRLGAVAGQRIQVSADTDPRLNTTLFYNQPRDYFESVYLDTLLVVYDQFGNFVYGVDDSASTDAAVDFIAPYSGDYFVAVNGRSVVTFSGSFLSDPFDPSSGGVTGAEGHYSLLIKTEMVPDKDVYSVDLRPGDVLSLAATGGFDSIQLFDPTGRLLALAYYSLATIDIEESPSFTDVGDAAWNQVVSEAGRYTIQVASAPPASYAADPVMSLASPYNLRVRVDRPGLELQPVHTHQVLFLDFDGFTLEDMAKNDFLETIGFQPPVDTFTSTTDLLEDLGYSASDRNTFIDRTLSVVTEMLSTDLDGLPGFGMNGNFAVTDRAGEFQIEILNSRDHADYYGIYPNVSRIFVGGSAEEFNVYSLFGIANAFDWGNFDLDDQALVFAKSIFDGLQDSLERGLVSLAPHITQLELFARGVGFVIAHEAGHNLGAWHTDPFDTQQEVMDSGGSTAEQYLQNWLGIGPDLILGSSDDVLIRFNSASAYDPREFVSAGINDTLNTVAYGLSTGTKLGTYFDFVTGTLYVTGKIDDGLRDTLLVRTEGNLLKVFINGDLKLARDAAGVNRVVLNGSSDKDWLDASKFEGVAILKGKANSDELLGGRAADLLFGGTGNDVLRGGQGNDILVGGEDDDKLYGDAGIDLLIGGDGSDKLFGVSGGDLLIGTRTSFDSNPEALSSILAEWSSRRSYEARVSNLKGTGTGARANGSNFLVVTGQAATVLEDSKVDELTGGSARDWFFARLSGSKKDKVNGSSLNEWVESLG